ncbi:MAG: DUF2341 domain-containing protein [Chitinispirillaceae bacterium]|nr:DUF2341 domain-containing protein [Chitinispirillaceae bacterium]
MDEIGNKSHYGGAALLSQRFTGEGWGGVCIVTALLYLCLKCSCSPSSSAGPGGTDFPNTRTVAGRIVHEDGTPGSFTVVRLIPDEFVPVNDECSACSFADSTDSNGYYAIPMSDSGFYNLQAVHLEKKTRLFVRSIEVTGEEDTVHIGERALATPGAIVVALPDSLDTVPGFLYLLGTCYRVSVDRAAGNAVLDSVPAGVAPPLFFTESAEGESPLLLLDSAIVVAGATTMVAPQHGANSMRLTLNTTASGADIAEDIYHFPLAIRFSSLPIPMEELRPGGSDLVITGSDARPLPVEIEMWDSGQGEALVWVLLDTVYGNDSTQSLYLFWGNDESELVSVPGAVFDTAWGFTAVWHLNEGGVDATVNGHDGVRQGKVADTAGILGGAQRFHGNDHITVEGLLGTPSTVTLSAWAQLDSADATGGEVVSIGDAVVIRMDDDWNNKGCQGSYFSSPGAHDTATHSYLGSEQFLAKTGWHHFAYVFDAAAGEHRFYIDGELCREKQVTVPIHYDSIGSDTKIGTHGNEKLLWDFIGGIDEVRVAHTVRSPGWIKLCYMNQRTENRLLVGNEE